MNNKNLTHPVKWSSSPLFAIYPTLDLMWIDLDSLAKPQAQEIRDRTVPCLANAPLIYAALGEEDPEVLLDCVQAFEEHEHYYFAHTRTGAEMRWEEGLSDHEILLALDTAKRVCANDRGFVLRVPLDEGCTGLPQQTRTRIANVKRSCKLVQQCGDTSEFIVEMLSFPSLKRFLHNRSFLQKYLERKIESLAEMRGRRVFEETSSQVSTVMETLESLWTHEPVDFFDNMIRFYTGEESDFQTEPGAQADSESWRVANCYDLIFSPQQPELVPPLSLDASFETFNERLSFEIERRFETFLKLADAGLSTYSDFLKSIRDSACEFMVLPSDHDKMMISFEESANVLEKGNSSFAVIRSISVPPRRRFERFLEDLTKLRERKTERMQYLRMAALHFESYRAPSMTVASSRTGGSNLGFSMYVAHEKSDLIWSVIIRSLKYFLLNPENTCPLAGVMNDCPSCILCDPRRREIAHEYVECPVGRFLDGIRLQID